MDRCRCGGTYIRITDGVTVEGMGTSWHIQYPEDHCDRCGCEPHETCDKCKEAERIGA